MQSVKMMEATNNEKKDLENTFKKKKEDYKNEAEERTTIEVEALREKLSLYMHAELSEQANAATKFLEELDRDFQNNHERITSEIFNSLIEV